MPRTAYKQIRFRADTMSLITTAIQIANDYAAQGFNLTLRQLYYQFVARDIIPNSDRSYDRLGSVINNARLAGYLDWNRITDRTRNLAGNTHWNSVGEIIEAVAAQYRIDLWDDQPYRLEVWVEKEALADVVGQAASSWDVDYFSCRGYVSQSEMWSAARRLRGYIEAGQAVKIIHLGDHDPSGIDMSRDITDRLTTFIFGDLCEDLFGGEPSDFTDETEGGVVAEYVVDRVREEHLADHPHTESVEPFELRRIALNMDQIRQYNPPPNPAKITDSRAQDYIKRFGRSSWELDALDPRTLTELISTEIGQWVDLDRYRARQDQIDTSRASLQQVSDRWPEVVEMLA